MNTLTVLTFIFVLILLLAWLPLLIIATMTIFQGKKTLQEAELLFKKINKTFETTTDVSKLISDLGIKAKPFIIKAIITYLIVQLLSKRLKKSD